MIVTLLIFIFFHSKGRHRLCSLSAGRPITYKFIYKGRTIEIAESYQYLGLVFSNNGNFNKAINILREKGRKAVYILMRKLSNYNVTLE